MEYLSTPHGRVRVQVYGQGSALLVAFHGFSDRAKMFENWHKSSLEKYTIVAIDLPFHGETEWQKDFFTPEDLGQITEQILDYFGSTRCSFLGFSFGARLVLGLLPAWAARLDEIILCSPDGPYVQGMLLAEKTPLFIRRWWQKSMQSNPVIGSNIIQFAQKIGLFSSQTARFMQKNWSSPTRYYRLLCCWVSMDYFQIPRKNLAHCLQGHSLRVRVYAGLHDPLLRPHRLTRFYASLRNTELHWLEAGHDLRVDF